MISFEKLEPLLKRVPTVVSQSKNVQLWGRDNLYPQRCEEVIKRSYTLKSVIESISDFIMGEGFLDPNVGSLIVNDSGFDGETLNKLLRRVAVTRTKWKSLVLHVGYDANYRFSSFTWLPIEYIRFPLPSRDGSFDYIWYSTNWENDRDKAHGTNEANAYHIFNSDPQVVESQIEEAGGIENYRGQILIVTQEPYQYPIASFDPVIDHAQAQEELAMFKLAYTQNGFLATTAFLYSGEFESEQEKKDYQALIKRKSGARNANGNIGMQDKSGTLKIGDLITSLQPTNMDRLFEFTESSAIKAIIENYGWPKILMGIQAENTLFNQEDIQNAYMYANSKTRADRMELSEIFSKLLANWAKPIATTAAIKEKVYGATVQPMATAPVQTNPNNNPGAAAASPTALTDSTPDSPRLNQTLTNLTGKQSQAIDRILRKYRKGVYTEGIARMMLKLSVGLTDEDLNEIFGELNPAEQL